MRAIGVKTLLFFSNLPQRLRFLESLNLLSSSFAEAGHTVVRFRPLQIIVNTEVDGRTPNSMPSSRRRSTCVLRAIIRDTGSCPTYREVQWCSGLLDRESQVVGKILSAVAFTPSHFGERGSVWNCACRQSSGPLRSRDVGGLSDVCALSCSLLVKRSRRECPPESWFDSVFERKRSHVLWCLMSAAEKTRMLRDRAIILIRGISELLQNVVCSNPCNATWLMCECSAVHRQCCRNIRSSRHLLDSKFLWRVDRPAIRVRPP